MKNNIILVINPGSTSTKISIFKDKDELFKKNLSHSPEELKEYKTIADQFPFRRDLIIKALNEAGFDIQDLDAIVWRWFKLYL